MANKVSWGCGSSRVVFPHLARLFGLRTFIETGTGFGDTLVFMAHHFEWCYSIEAMDWNYKLAQASFSNIGKVELIGGSSAEELPKLLARIPNTPTFFFLDAHMGVGEVDPLAAEIRAVQTYRPDALVAIDDVGENTHHDVQLSELRAQGVSLEGWKMDYRFKRIMFLHRGQYNIPELD